MFDDIVKFFQNLLKSKKPGVTQSETGQSILKTTAEEAKKTDITDPALTGKYDPTTPPGQFKEQKPIIKLEKICFFKLYTHNIYIYMYT